MNMAKSIPPKFEIRIKDNVLYCTIYEKELILADDLMPIINYIFNNKTNIIYSDFLVPKSIEIIGYTKFSIDYNLVDIKNLTFDEIIVKIEELIKIINLILIDIEKCDKSAIIYTRDILLKTSAK